MLLQSADVIVLSQHAEISQKRQREPNGDSRRCLRDVHNYRNFEQAMAAQSHGVISPNQASATIRAVSAIATKSIDQSTMSRPKRRPLVPLS
jgi:hypothetical protein